MGKENAGTISPTSPILDSIGSPLDVPKKPLQAGRPQIIRSSDGGIIGSSDDHHQLIGSVGRGWLVRWWMMKGMMMKRMIGRNSHTLELGELGGLAFAAAQA